MNKLIVDFYLDEEKDQLIYEADEDTEIIDILIAISKLKDVVKDSMDNSHKTDNKFHNVSTEKEKESLLQSMLEDIKYLNLWEDIEETEKELLN